MDHFFKPIKMSLSLLLISAMALSITGCQGQSKDHRDVTAKADSSSSSQVSETQSSVWCPESGDDSKETSKKESSDAGESKTSAQTSASIFEVPEDFQDNGIFSSYYEDAYKQVVTMSLEEKIGQMIFAEMPSSEALAMEKNFHLGGYLMSASHFSGKSKTDVQDMISSLVIAQEIPIVIAVDEEGGTVTRVSSNKSLSSRAFSSPRDLYKAGGMAYIQSDADEKASLLKELGIEINLAPVCDICTNSGDFMYSRSLGEGASTTAEFVRTVTEISQSKGVSVTLKHFPGYGSNSDTHTGSSVDSRELSELQNNDFVPFKAGIDAGAHLVMVNHNIVNCIDSENPASLSEKVHKMLRSELGFTGLIITDDIAMDAISKSSGTSPAVAAVLAGNDIIIMDSTMVESSVKDVKEAVEKGTINEKTINHAVMRILSWKYAKGVL